jgi:hypothetical protein
MKRLTKHILLVSTLCLAFGCTDYDIRNDGVYYESWNEAHGKTEILVENADKATFEKISDNYGKDKEHVFYRTKLIPGADPESFELIKGGYAIDKYRIYYYGDSVENSNSKDFEILDPYFSRDRRDVYYRTKPLGVKDLKEFKFLTNNNLNDRWSTDGNYYWFNNFKVPSSNYEEIELLDSTAGFSQDNETVYYLDRDLRYNSEGKRILDTIDIETFVIKRHIDCRDKFGCINIYHGRTECK